MRLCVALASLIMLAGCATRQFNAAPVGIPTMDSRIDALMRAYDNPNGPGAAVLVLREGEVVFQKGYGLADVEQKTAVTPSTDFRLASITKQFTASAILLLVERGKLSLDDPVNRYLPELPAYGAGMTVRDLLTHSSGIIDYEDIMPKGTTKQLHDIDVLHLVSEQKETYFAPGTSYRYSNGGYAFLALIVERVSGQRFADFLRENIFVPAGMKSTLAFEEGISTVPNRAFGYSRSGSQWTRTDQSLTSAVLGDGGVYSSVADMALWIEALENGTVLSNSSMELATLPSVNTDDPATRYGFGWRVSLHGNNRMIWHTGESIGFRNALLHFPDKRVAVILLTNRDEGEPKETALAIADLYL